MKKCIEINNLTVSYEDGINVLDHINFTANYGDFILLYGNSGSGKSTLSNCLNGIIPYYTNASIEGDICINGSCINEMNIVERSKFIGSVLQNAEEQIIHDYVEDEIAFALENQGIEVDSIKNLN